MDHHLEYLAQEVGYDYAGGLLSRREALRRLGLLGFGVVGASSLLAACGGDEPETGGGTATSTSAPASTSAPTSAPITTEAVTYPGRHGTLQGALAGTGTRGAVLVIHENRGLTDHIRSVASRLAADGYTALAVDLLSEDGGTASLGESANATAALGKVAPGRFVDDMRSSLDELARRRPGTRLGIVGFCFGGMQVWELLAAGEPRLAAAAPFYGPAPNTDFSRSEAAVLGVYAELDGDRVNGTREAARAGLQRAGLTHEIRTFPGVDHAFFNDTGQRYNAEQAREAYRALTDWFARHLGG